MDEITKELLEALKMATLQNQLFKARHANVAARDIQQSEQLARVE